MARRKAAAVLAAVLLSFDGCSQAAEITTGPDVGNHEGVCDAGFTGGRFKDAVEFEGDEPWVGCPCGSNTTCFTCDEMALECEYVCLDEGEVCTSNRVAAEEEVVDEERRHAPPPPRRRRRQPRHASCR